MLIVSMTSKHFNAPVHAHMICIKEPRINIYTDNCVYWKNIKCKLENVVGKKTLNYKQMVSS